MQAPSVELMDPCDRSVQICFRDEVWGADGDCDHLSMGRELPMRLLKPLVTLAQRAQLTLESLLSHGTRLPALLRTHP
jgi:hypothetical protein